MIYGLSVQRDVYTNACFFVRIDAVHLQTWWQLHEAGNLEQVLRTAEALAQGRRPGGGRRPDQGFMLSAARSLVFNAIVAARVEQGSWNRLQAGDVANLDGRGSVFAVDAPDAELEARCTSLEIHPTAPLVGAGVSLAQGEIRRLEESIAAQFPEALAVVGTERMNAERRATRLPSSRRLLVTSFRVTFLGVLRPLDRFGV